MLSDPVALDFELEANIRIPQRKAFNSLKPLPLNSSAIYTLPGRAADNTIVGAETFRFAGR